MFYCRCFYLFRRATSELPRPIAVILCHMIAISCRFIMQVQKFGGPPPKEIGGQKHAKFGAISDNFRFRSRISPELDKISKIGKKCDHRILHVFGPQFLWGRASEFLDLHYKIHLASDHVLKFHGDRPRELGDLVAKETKHHG